MLIKIFHALTPLTTLYPEVDGYLRVFTFFLFRDLLLRILRRNSQSVKINFSRVLFCSKVFMFSHFRSNITCSIFVTVNIFCCVNCFADLFCCISLLF